MGHEMFAPRRGAVRRRYVNEAKHAVTMSRAWARNIAPGPAGDLPSIVIIGVQRGGTTSLFRYLGAHHQIVAPLSKELNYLSLHYGNGVGWYRGHFPRLPEGTQTLEASPLYLVDPRVPARAAAELPSTRFIALLRNPVERAYSHYLHNLEHGFEPLPFVDALEAEPERLARAERMGLDTRRGLMLMRNSSYAHRGLYADHLSRWYEHVPRERVHVLRSEDLFSDPETTFNTLIDQMGLEPASGITFKRMNHWEDDSVTQLTPQVRRQLEERFRAPNERLASMLNWTETWAPAVSPEQPDPDRGVPSRTSPSS